MVDSPSWTASSLGKSAFGKCPTASSFFRPARRTCAKWGHDSESTGLHRGTYLHDLGYDDLDHFGLVLHAVHLHDALDGCLLLVTLVFQHFLDCL